MAECAVLAGGVRWLALKAAGTGDQGDAALAALHAQESATRVIYDVHQMFAAMGMTLEHPLHLWTYRLKALLSELGGRGGQASAVAQHCFGPALEYRDEGYNGDKMNEPAPLLFEIEDRVAILTLNRPAEGNSLNPELLIALEQAWRRIESDDAIRVAVLTGAGERHFCTGAAVGALKVGMGSIAEQAERGSEPLLAADVRRDETRHLRGERFGERRRPSLRGG